MHRWAWVILFSLVVLVPFIACSASKRGIKSPPASFDFVEVTLSRDIERKGADSIPLGQSDIFYTNDTKGKIEGILRSYLPMNLDKYATLYVYFAGHGVPGLQDGDAFIVTYDGEPRFIEYTGYKLKILYADIDNRRPKGQSFLSTAASVALRRDQEKCSSPGPGQRY